MFVDKFLSRFSISTKVLAFVFPFVLSISAVGLMGLYASGLLQHRMEISNGMMGALSGFRDVSTAMDKFLVEPSEETRSAVSDALTVQQSALQTSLAGLDDTAVGREDLEKAIRATEGIDGRIGGLWDLYQRESELDASIAGGLSALVSAQMELSDEATRLQRAVRNEENEAKAALRQAARLTDGGQFVTSLVNQTMAAGSPERQFPFLTAKLGDLVKTQRKVLSALTGNQGIIGKNFAESIADLRERVQSGDMGPDNADAVKAILRKFRQYAEAFDEASASKTSEAINQFADVDAKVVVAEEVLAGSRKLITGVYDLRIVAEAFRITKDQEGMERIDRQVKLIADNLETLGASIEDKAFFDKLSAHITPALAALKDSSIALVDVSAERKTEYAEANQAIVTAWSNLTTFSDMQKQAAVEERVRANGVSISTTVIGILLAVLGGIALVLTLQRPIAAITGTMRRIADGDLETTIAGEARGDEIGAMARALGIFKNNARAKIEVEAQSEQQRESAEAERRRNDEEKQALDAEIDHAVTKLAAALERLAAGDISFQIEGKFNGRLERLRVDFNLSLQRLRDTMGKITHNVGLIQNNGRQMAGSTGELSKRTEQQAASLEQTAAAVDEITATVRGAAERAKEADSIVGDTKRNADESAVVVGNAISAMGRIEEASRKIEQIIDVIEDIAFQTNLLALNAGIEAARAGDAGKGFAVVAQEVRELAQRSGGAAQEIKGLINSSSEEVATGSTHVKEAGDVLQRISEQIATISQHVNMIATASQEQSAALQEINTSVNYMDQMTQQNAAMVEEATAASHDLANETDDLMVLVRQFRIEAEGVTTRHPSTAAA